MPDEPSAGREPRGDSTPPEGGASAGGAPVGGGGGTPEFLEAGFFPRGAGVPAPGRARGSRRGSGFAAGEVLDASLPGPALAGSADAVTWTGQGVCGDR
jgi:hypothetical protein